MTGSSDRRLCFGAVADAGAQAWRRRLGMRGSQSWALLNGGPLGSLTRAIALSAAALLVSLLVGWGLAGTEDVEGDATPETALTLESATPTSLTVTWDDVPNATLYSVRWRLTGQTAFSPSYAATGGRYQITGLLPGRNYRVRIEVSGGSGVVFRILGGTWRTPLTAPRNLTVTAATADSLSLSWTKPDGWNPAGYRLRWRKPSDAQFQGSVKLAGSATSHTITGLTDQTQYVVNLLALNDLGSGSTEARLDAYAVDPLTLRLNSTYEVCTANTLTELTWEITGGLKPRRLWIEGQQIEVDNVESHRVNCGPIPSDPVTGDPLPNPTKTFSAVVKDRRGVDASARTTADLAEALAAPADVGHVSHNASAQIGWEWSHTQHSDAPPPNIAVIRYRSAAATEWSYRLATYWRPDPSYLLDLTQGEHKVSVAAIRHELELHSPHALNWSDEQDVVGAFPPANVRVTATHDTITVSWDRQPHMLGQRTSAAIRLADQPHPSGPSRRKSVDEVYGQRGRHKVVFQGVYPDTAYTVTLDIGVPDRPVVSTTTVRTIEPPAGWTAPPRGPQNLAATATEKCITATWDPPHVGAPDEWHAQLYSVQTGERWNSYFITDESSWTVCGWRSGHPLTPGADYRIVVTHFSITRDSAEVVVTVPTAPQGRSQATQLEGGRGTDLLPFRPQWPVSLDGRFALTDDPFEWRLSAVRYHAGLDIGERGGGTSGSPTNSEGDVKGSPVYAFADGVLRLFGYTEGQVVVYCHDENLLMHERFHVTVDGAGSAWWSGERLRTAKEGRQAGDVFCDDVTTTAGGRVALITHDPPAGSSVVTKYAHLEQATTTIERALADDPTCLDFISPQTVCVIDNERAVQVAAGQLIGSVGNSYYSEQNMFADDHLHFEIRYFDREPKSEDWWYFNVDGCRTTYLPDCAWSSSEVREMVSVEDVEPYLAPAPASVIPTDSGWNLSLPIASANSGRRIFEVQGITSTVSGLRANVSIGLWRPLFYTGVTQQSRAEPTSIAGTGPGVTGYGTDITASTPGGPHEACGGGPLELADTATATTTEGELPRQSRAVSLTAADSACVLYVFTVNEAYPSPEAMVLPDPDDLYRKRISLVDPKVTLRHAGSLVAGSGSETGTLTGIQFEIYEVEAVGGEVHKFCSKQLDGECVDEGDGVGIAFELWQGSERVKFASDDDAKTNISWTPDASATYFLVVRGDYAEQATVPNTGSYTVHYSIPASTCPVRSEGSSTAQCPAPEPVEVTIDADAIGGDGTVNIAEKAAGFPITGTATAGASVSVTVGGKALSTDTENDDGGWSVTVPANRDYIEEDSVSVVAVASKTGLTNNTAPESFAVDLTAPVVTYDEVSSLQVGAMVTIELRTAHSDIASYALAAGAKLPAGLDLDTTTRVVMVRGTPTERGAGATTTVISVEDDAENIGTVTLSLPRVEGLAQPLEGFKYGSGNVELGGDVPMLTAPTGAVGALSYSATASPAGACTVDASTGALTIHTQGTCAVTVTAAATTTHEAGTDLFTVTIGPRLATPVLSLSAISKDSVTMSWGTVEDAEGYEWRWCDISDISDCDDDDYQDGDTSGLTKQVDNLSAATRYQFEVRATSASVTDSKWATEQATTNVEVQIRARKLANGKVEWVLRYRSGEDLEPDLRFADPTKMTDGEWRRSSLLSDEFAGGTYELGRVLVKLDNTTCAAQLEVNFQTSGGEQITPNKLKFSLDTAVNTWLTTEWFEVPLSVMAAAAGSGAGGGESGAETSLDDTSGVADPGPGVEGGQMLGDGPSGEQAASASDDCADEPSGLSTSGVSKTAAILSWAAVTGASQYDVRRDAGVSTELSKTTTIHPFTGLSAGTTYSLKVRARNPWGASGWSATSVTTVPPEPTGLSASATTTSLTLSWNAASGATSYEVKRSGSTTETSISASVRSHPFSGLSGNTEYTLSVRAVNASGASDWVPLKKSTKQLEDPTNVAADDATSSSLTLNWSAVSEATSYKVKRTQSTTETTKVSTARSHPFTGLEANTSYTLSVRAVNSGGQSNWVTATASTTAATPEPPPTYTFEGRARARVRSSGRVEFCFQLRDEECILPTSRYVTPASMDDGHWYNSSAVTYGGRTLGKVSVMKPAGASYIDVCFTPEGGTRSCPTPNNFYWGTATVDHWQSAGWMSYSIADGSSGSDGPPAAGGAMQLPNADEPAGGNLDGGAMADDEPDPAGS